MIPVIFIYEESAFLGTDFHVFMEKRLQCVPGACRKHFAESFGCRNQLCLVDLRRQYKIFFPGESNEPVHQLLMIGEPIGSAVFKPVQF